MQRCRHYHGLDLIQVSGRLLVVGTNRVRDGIAKLVNIDCLIERVRIDSRL